MNDRQAPPPFVSIIMPLLNEEKYLQKTLESLLAQDYCADHLEILCIDGGSDDRTLDILRLCASTHKRFKILSNTGRKTAIGLNIGIRAALGTYIVRVDGHSIYPSDYISTLIRQHRALGAANVGTVCHTRSLNQTIVGRAASFVLSSRFGVGNSRFRIGSRSVEEVDTVPFGCYEREIFSRIGFFDERLHRTEDYEFNQRLRRHGGRIFLLPSPGLTFYTRDSLGELVSKQFGNGYGVAETAMFFRLSSSIAWRHLVPLMFVGYLLCLPIAACVSWLAFLPLVLYGLVGLGFALKAAARERSLPVGACAAILFPMVHIAYGIGSLTGSLRSTRWLRQARVI